jgi:hypothetical protein
VAGAELVVEAAVPAEADRAAAVVVAAERPS